MAALWTLLRGYTVLSVIAFFIFVPQQDMTPEHLLRGNLWYNLWYASTCAGLALLLADGVFGLRRRFGREKSDT